MPSTYMKSLVHLIVDLFSEILISKKQNKTQTQTEKEHRKMGRRKRKEEREGSRRKLAIST